MDSQLVSHILQIVVARPLPQDTKMVAQIVNFLNYMSLSEQGAKCCAKYALIEKVFALFTDKDAINMLSGKHANSNTSSNRQLVPIVTAVQRYMSNIEGVKDVIIKQLVQVLQRLVQMKDIFQRRLEHYVRQGPQN